MLTEETGRTQTQVHLTLPNLNASKETDTGGNEETTRIVGPNSNPEASPLQRWDS